MRAEDAPLKLRKEMLKSGEDEEGQDEERVFLEGWGGGAPQPETFNLDLI